MSAKVFIYPGYDTDNVILVTFSCNYYQPSQGESQHHYLIFKLWLNYSTFLIILCNAFLSVYVDRGQSPISHHLHQVIVTQLITIKITFDNYALLFSCVPYCFHNTVLEVRVFSLGFPLKEGYCRSLFIFSLPLT